MSRRAIRLVRRPRMVDHNKLVATTLGPPPTRYSITHWAIDGSMKQWWPSLAGMAAAAVGTIGAWIIVAGVAKVEGLALSAIVIATGLLAGFGRAGSDESHPWLRVMSHSLNRSSFDNGRPLWNRHSSEGVLVNRIALPVAMVLALAAAGLFVAVLVYPWMGQPGWDHDVGRSPWRL